MVYRFIEKQSMIDVYIDYSTKTKLLILHATDNNAIRKGGIKLLGLITHVIICLFRHPICL